MIVLSPATFARMERAIKYPSITGGRGVRVDRQPGGGVSINMPPVSDAGGLPIGPPGVPTAEPGPEPSIIFPPWQEPYNPFGPANPS